MGGVATIESAPNFGQLVDAASICKRELASRSRSGNQGNDDFSQRTREQASSLEETAASMKQLISTVKQNAENASHTSQLARGATEQAVLSGEIAGNAALAMGEASASSHTIADIVGLITFQTNLQALNAAVNRVPTSRAAASQEQSSGIDQVNSAVVQMDAVTQQNAGLVEEAAAASQPCIGRCTSCCRWRSSASRKLPASMSFRLDQAVGHAVLTGRAKPREYRQPASSRGRPAEAAGSRPGLCRVVASTDTSRAAETFAAAAPDASFGSGERDQNCTVAVSIAARGAPASRVW